MKWFNGQKGFGFIQPDDGLQGRFVHVSAVERAGMRGLNEGQKIDTTSLLIGRPANRQPTICACLIDRNTASHLP